MIVFARLSEGSFYSYGFQYSARPVQLQSQRITFYLATVFSSFTKTMLLISEGT